LRALTTLERRKEECVKSKNNTFPHSQFSLTAQMGDGGRFVKGTQKAKREREKQTKLIGE